MNSIQMLGIFHITAFYIERSRRRQSQPHSNIRKLLELIRQLRCEIEINIRPLPWRHLKGRISMLDLSNVVFERYLLRELRAFLELFKNNTEVYDKIKKLC